MAEKVRTKPNRPWAIKLLIYMVVVGAIGAWFHYDATVAYPNRGRADASYRLWTYLERARESGRLRLSELQDADPGAELARLDGRYSEGQDIGDFAAAKREWYRSLSVLGKLDEATVSAQLTENPNSRLDELRNEWQGPGARPQPKPLHAYDLKIQGGIAIVCYLGVLGMLIHMGRVMMVKYEWEPAEKRLHLPGGVSITPYDLEDVDKRKWHKFIVFLKIKKGHGNLGGKELRLDLYQYAGLEEWVLEMERTAFPDRVEEEKPEPEIETVQEETQ
jgi:hypothetical protein